MELVVALIVLSLLPAVILGAADLPAESLFVAPGVFPIHVF